jgi:co-chaperonin GroES (HSP10)
VSAVSIHSMQATDIAEQAAEWDAQEPGKRPAIFMPRAFNALSVGNTVEYLWKDLDEAFPAVDPLHEPLGCLVLCQVRQPPLRTRGGMLIDTESRKTEHYNTQVAKVVAIGPNAFQNRNTGAEWVEGAWAKVGDYVRIPKYQGDHWTISYTRPDYDIDPDTGARKPKEVEDEVVFVMFKDLNLLARVKEPLAVKAFL